jgi:hypothetical protein
MTAFDVLREEFAISKAIGRHRFQRFVERQIAKAIGLRAELDAGNLRIDFSKGAGERQAGERELS